MLRVSILFSGFLLLLSCTKDDPTIPNEEELITSLLFTLKDFQSGEIRTFSFIDIDGDGGFDPEILNPALTANSEFTGTIQLFNQNFNPPLNIGEEVEEEGAEHQFFYIPSAELNVQIAYDDMDLLAQPLGIRTHVKTGKKSSGTLTVILRHEPNKSDPLVQSGNINNAGGETDIEVKFHVEIE